MAYETLEQISKRAQELGHRFASVICDGDPRFMALLRTSNDSTGLCLWTEDKAKELKAQGKGDNGKLWLQVVNTDNGFLRYWSRAF